MYLEPDDTEKIKEIFKRLNKNSYNLNRMEKQSTQLVEYDYMIIAKIVAGLIRFENIDSYLDEIHELFEEEESGDEYEVTNYSKMEDEGDDIPADIKRICKWENIKFLNNILSEDYVFSAYDRQRQIALQYFLNIFSCILKGEMINRNVTEKTIIELSDIPKEIIEEKLILCNTVCEKLIEIYKGDIDVFWKNKTSFFTLLYVMVMSPEISGRRTADELSDLLDSFQKSASTEWKDYYEASNQGVNDKKIREVRVNILNRILS